jgi:VWFA-related protein
MLERMPAWFPLPALACFAALAAGAQEAKPSFEEPATLRITVTLVQVDAVVTDSKGHRIADLKPEDFEIQQDGKVQKITHFSYIPEAPPPTAVKSKRKAEEPPPLVAPGQVQRTVALVVDDLALSFESLVRVRNALHKYVDEQMQPGDLVALVRTAGGVAILEQFTADKRVLLENIDLLKWRFHGRGGLVPLDPLAGAPESHASPGEPEILDYGAGVSAVGTLDTIQQVIAGMKELPGRKSVVVFSDSLRMDRDLNGAIERLTDLANRSAVSLYTVYPRGLETYSPGAADRGASRRSSRHTSRTTRREDAALSSQDGLIYLAHQTGGLFFNGNDIPAAIRRATDDQLGYYLLGYSPPEGTFEKDSQSAKFHSVSVSVRRPELAVRWKSGFTGVADRAAGARAAATPKTPEQQILDALASPFRATGLHVRLTSLYTDAGEDGPVVQSMLHFDARDLTFKREPDGSWHTAVDVVIAAYRGMKQPAQQRQRSQDILLPDDVYRQALKEGFVYNLDDPMTEAGAFLMRAVVRDSASGRIGSASEFVQVPDTRKGQLALSGIMLKLAPPEPEGAAQPAAPAAARDGKVEAWVEGGPAIRRYRTGQDILYAFMVINPALRGSPKRPSVVSEARVFRNGKLYYQGRPSPLPDAGRLDDRRFVGGGRLRLGDKLIPGEYLLEVLVTDRLGKKGNTQAAQWIDFEVAGVR